MLGVKYYWITLQKVMFLPAVLTINFILELKHSYFHFYQILYVRATSILLLLSQDVSHNLFHQDIFNQAF